MRRGLGGDLGPGNPHTGLVALTRLSRARRRAREAEGRAHRHVLPRLTPTHTVARVSDYAFVFELQLKAARIAPSPNRTPKTMNRAVAGLLV
jgi:hypothetical protein